MQISVNLRLIENKTGVIIIKNNGQRLQKQQGRHMKYIAQKITSEAAKEPVNPANPRSNKTKVSASAR